MDTGDDGFDIFRWAAETDNPSEIEPSFLEWLLASPTPERVEQIRERMGDEGVGNMARGLAERLLDTTATGEHDLKHFPERFNGLPEDFLKALFGAHGYQRMKDIAITSSVVFPASAHTSGGFTGRSLSSLCMAFCGIVGVLILFDICVHTPGLLLRAAKTGTYDDAFWGSIGGDLIGAAFAAAFLIGAFFLRRHLKTIDTRVEGNLGEDSK